MASAGSMAAGGAQGWEKQALLAALARGDTSYVEKEALLLPGVPQHLQLDVEVVRAAAKVRNGVKYLPAMHNDHNLMLEAYKVQGYSMQEASDMLKGDWAFILEAVQVRGTGFEYASEELRGNKAFVLQAMDASPHPQFVFKYASEELRGQRDMVEMALQKTPRYGRADVLKAAPPPWNQLPEFLVLAGILDDRSEHKEPASGEDIVFSVKFSLAAASTPIANEFLSAVKDHDMLKNYRVYFPNGFKKSFCGDFADITKLEGHCKGACMSKCRWGATCDGSGTNPSEPCHSTNAPVTNHSCWAFSFRWHQDRAAQNKGFMVQIMEPSVNVGTGRVEFGLGAGQVIETIMAKDMGLKVFRIQLADPDIDLMKAAVRVLALKVQDWRAHGCQSMAPVHLDHAEVMAGLQAGREVSFVFDVYDGDQVVQPGQLRVTSELSRHLPLF